MPESIQAILKISKEDRTVQVSNNLLKTIPEKKRKLLIPLKKVENQLDKLKELEEEICGQIRERETLVNVEKEKIKKSDEKMMLVKNQKEYVASQKEIEVAKKTIKKVEDQILELEEKKETISKELAEVLEEYRQKKEVVSVAEKEVLEEERKLLDKVEAYNKMKKELLPKINQELYTVYEKLTKRKVVPAAVEISSSNCMGCAMSIPAQLFNDIIRESSGKCPHCGRLLVYKAPEKPKEAPKAKKKTKAKKSTKAKTTKSTKAKAAKST